MGFLDLQRPQVGKHSILDQQARTRIRKRLFAEKEELDQFIPSSTPVDSPNDWNDLRFQSLCDADSRMAIARRVVWKFLMHMSSKHSICGAAGTVFPITALLTPYLFTDCPRLQATSPASTILRRPGDTKIANIPRIISCWTSTPTTVHILTARLTLLPGQRAL